MRSDVTYLGSCDFDVINIVVPKVICMGWKDCSDLRCFLDKCSKARGRTWVANIRGRHSRCMPS